MSNDWDRIEPHTRTDRLEEGMAARVADPLWMLARQWQVGEFRGEDAASPLRAQVHVSSAPLRMDRDGQPLEAQVEAEPTASAASGWRLAAEAGLQLLRRLDQEGLGALRTTLRDRFPLRLPEDAIAGLPASEVRRLRLLARRSVDARAVLAATPQVRRAAGLPDAIVQKLEREVAARTVEPRGATSSWVDRKLAYDLSVSASTDEGELVLGADDYAGGTLDWYSFQARPGRGPRAPMATKRLDLVPIPLSFPGMAASRWWEFEEGTVNFGGIEAGPADLGRLVVAEFAAIASDDWFLLPVRAAVGSVVRVEQVDVLDGFGGIEGRHAVRSAAELDAAKLPPGAERAWGFFELEGDASATEGRTPWLFLPPIVVGSLEGPALERVTFTRDENANLAWAIEGEVETAYGRARGRRQEWSPPASRPPRGDAWAHRLESPVPPHWIPLVPERPNPASAEIQLRRGRLLAWGDDALAGPRGRLLVPEQPLWIDEAAIPASGLEVTRHWQRARGPDGAVYLWLGRRKRPGRPNRGSGLEFDALER